MALRNMVHTIKRYFEIFYSKSLFNNFYNMSSFVSQYFPEVPKSQPASSSTLTVDQFLEHEEVDY